MLGIHNSSQAQQAKVTVHGNNHSPSRRLSVWPDTIEWILIAAFLVSYGVMSFISPGLPGKPIPSTITAVSGYLLVFIHGIRRYGWKMMLFFFVVTWIVSNFFENLSIMTGFPFGHYHYTGDPKIFLVPWAIGLAYFLFGYGAWTLASTLLGRSDANLNLRTRRGRVNIFLLPLFSGVLMTLWDLSMDSISSTINSGWIWRDGGAFFGVAPQNYFGWVFVTWFFFQIFAIALAIPQTRGVPGYKVARRTHSTPPILLYMTTGIGAIGTFVTSANTSGTITDRAGTVWHLTDIYGSMMLVAVLTVITLSIVGLGKILRGDETAHADLPSEHEARQV